ncbi:MAG: penicillin-binding protein activator [Proteobacteria bacterium]|nr:penicillin-binding protein activator [Pseudomonadota bacterium]
MGTSSSWLQPSSPLLAKKIQRYPKSADTYIELAQKSESPEKEKYQLDAVGRLIQDDSLSRAEELLQQIQTTHLPVELTNQKLLLKSKIELANSKPEQALSTLGDIQQVNTLTEEQNFDYHSTLADAYAKQGNYFYSIQQRIKLEPLIHDPNLTTSNQQQIWQTLSEISPEQLHSLELETNQKELKGWVQLASLVKEKSDQPSALKTGIKEWMSRYPEHPATPIAQYTLSRIENVHSIEANKIALLVPLNGPLSLPGKAVRDGFIAAAKNAGKGEDKVQTYDTSTGDIKTLYQQAVQNGAEVIVGPLDKNKVQTLADDSNLVTVPTLALNYSAPARLPNNLYEIGISPQDEAAQVAAKASQQGYKNAIVIAPSGAWGQGIAETFADQWKKQGGRIADRMAYSPKQNFTKPIKQLLHAYNGKGRGKSARGGSRHDVDMVFLVATPSVARQVVPLFKFYYAGNIPIYATSLVYNGTPEPALDRDLNGVIFCDMPWVFEDGGNLEKNYEQTSPQWPSALNRYTRLYALGFDAFNLSQQLTRLDTSPELGISAHTGKLYANADHRVSRQLQWAKFQNGTPEIIS